MARGIWSVTALFKLFRTTTFRFSLIFLLFFGSAAVVAIGYIYWNAKVLLIQQLNQTVQAEIQGLAEQYQQGGMPLLTKTVAERSRIPGNSLYLVTDKNGRYLAGNLQVVTRTLWDVVGDVRFSYKRPAQGGKETRRAYAKTFRLPRGFRLLVGRDIEDRRVFDDVIGSVFWGLGLMTLFGLLGGWLVSRNLLSKLDDVTSTSKSIMRGDLSERIPIRGSGDEFDRLSVNLNQMLDKIEQLMAGLREVSDNIAHDLKTPLSRMRNRIDAALQDPHSHESYKKTLEETFDDTDRLIKVFNALLSIARMESGSAPVNAEELDLSQVIQDVTELYEPVIEEHNIQLTTDFSDELSLSADRQLIGQAVANLIDNAVKYSNGLLQDDAKTDLDLHIMTQKHNGYAEIIVSDHGPGIPEEDKERVLKRFVRLEKSRSLPGSGLGLSLVAAVAQLHDGHLKLEDNDPGLKAIIQLPLN